MRVELHSGELTLTGEVHEPLRSVDPDYGVILCHGSTQMGRRYPLIQFLASKLSAYHPVLAFDLPGFGSSPPLVVDSLDDYLMGRHLQAATKFLWEEFGLDSVVIGHSMGGRVAIQGAVGDSRVKALALIAGLYLFPRDVNVVVRLLESFSRVVRAEWRIGFRELAEELVHREPQSRALSKLGRPLLAVQAGREQYDFIRRTQWDALRLASGPACIAIMDDANHSFHGKYEAVYEITYGWLRGTLNHDK